MCKSQLNIHFLYQISPSESCHYAISIIGFTIGSFQCARYTTVIFKLSLTLRIFVSHWKILPKKKNEAHRKLL